MLAAVVGRQTEQATLAAAARRAVVDGRGAVAVVVGQPGIGKTHLLDRFAEAATEQGLSVFAASAYELERRRPFGVLVDALGVRSSVEDSWRTRVAARLDAQAAGAGDPAGFLIGEEIYALVDELCSRGPTALVLDDVQWVDPTSLGLIARLCRVAPQQRLVIVLSVRPPPRPDDVTRLVTGVQAAGAVELQIEPLTDAEVAELVAAAIGAPPGDSLRTLLRRTAGSPLFVRELIAGLRADGALRIDGDRVETTATGIPASLAVAVRHRLAQLDPATMEMLRLAAVLSGPFTLPQLGHVTGRRPVELYATVEAALEAGVLRDDDGRLGFTHEVIRVTLYDDIPHAVRIGLHRDIAGALQAAGAPALEVAEHYVRGATPGDREVVQGLREAATTVARQSPVAAADLLERAAALLPAVDPEQPALGRERARYLAAGGRARDAETLCRQLLEARADPDAERSIRLTLSSALLAQSRMTEALDEARWLAARATPGTPGWARATAGLSYALLTAGQITEAEHTAHEMTERADATEPSAVFTACMTLAVACRFRARAGEGLTYLDRAAEVAGGLPQQVVNQNPVALWRALVLLDLDRLDEALVAARRGRAAAEEAGVSWALANYEFATASTLYARGEVDDAVAEYRAGMELAQDLGTGWRLSAYGGLASIAVRRAELDGAAGLIAEGEAYLRRTGDQPQLPLFLRAKAELLAAQGRPGDALAELVGVWWPLLRGDVLGSVPFFAPDVVRLAVAEGDDELAAAMLEAARTAAERMGTSTAEATALRCHGIVHQDLDAFVAAADAVAENPRPLARASAHEDAGEALAASGRLADARAHLIAALDAYEQLGAVRDVDRVDASARGIGVRRGQRGRRSRPSHGWDSLTTTERRVADLVAAGLSNPVIAERMFLSRRTIQTHVSHILAKTGLSSRIEVAAAMARRDS
jgi:DNA-binding CsgD family transcriptional regulator/tetratricopeptide (TPR) repeat protein